jgi:putative transposase
MARRARFIQALQPHLVRQSGHDGAAVARDAEDARCWLETLREVAATHRLAVHGYALRRRACAWLVTPPTAEALPRALQDLGRRYVGAFNARHQRSGTLWDGRYQCALVQDGAWVDTALVWVEAGAPPPAATPVPGEPLLDSRSHHLGQHPQAWLVDPPVYWALGNTPFERQSRWAQQLAAGVAPGQAARIEAALRSGRPIGDARWLQALQAQTGLQLVARPRGRPPGRRTAPPIGLSPPD